MILLTLEYTRIPLEFVVKPDLSMESHEIAGFMGAASELFNFQSRSKINGWALAFTAD